jgi:hypothetical protein
MKKLIFSLFLVASSANSFASNRDPLEVCVTNAARAFNYANTQAQRDLNSQTDRCSKMPQIDVKNECVNDAFAAYEIQSRDNLAQYEAALRNCP